MADKNVVNRNDAKTIIRIMFEEGGEPEEIAEAKLSLEEEFKIITEQFKAKAGSDYAASRGEYLNSIIMANYLGYEFIDAAEVILFDETGKFNAEKTNEVLG